MKKRRFNIAKVYNLVAKVCFVSLVLFLLATLGLRTFNVEMNSKIRTNKDEIVRLQSEVDVVTAQVKELSSYAQVVEVINEKKMKVTNGSIIDLD